tara:strand:- start:3263 stop:4117 length:855 start_codon:yes stop_codon:yes gene_type:complete
MKLYINIPFNEFTYRKITDYNNYKEKLQNLICYENNFKETINLDYGLLSFLLFPQTQNTLILYKIGDFFKFFYNIDKNKIDNIIFIINKLKLSINQPFLSHIHDNQQSINNQSINNQQSIDNQSTYNNKVYTIISSILDISNNKKWKNLFLEHLHKILIVKKNTLNDNIIDKILNSGGDILILLTQLFTPIYLNNDFIYSFSLCILIINDLFSFEIDNSNFNLNNIYFSYTDNGIKHMTDLLNKHINIIKDYTGIHYYKSLLYNFAIWKSFYYQPEIVNICIKQ